MQWMLSPVLLVFLSLMVNAALYIPVVFLPKKATVNFMRDW